MADVKQMSASVWAFTEHEHLDLVRGINRIHEIACEAGSMPRLELSVDLLDVLHWVDGTLEPHIAWEEAWLYPEIDARTDSPWATRAARFDHRQIRGVASEIRADQGALSSRRVGEHDSENSLSSVQSRGARPCPHRARGAVPHPDPDGGRRDGMTAATDAPGDAGPATGAGRSSPTSGSSRVPTCRIARGRRISLSRSATRRPFAISTRRGSTTGSPRRVAARAGLSITAPPCPSRRSCRGVRSRSSTASR